MRRWIRIVMTAAAAIVTAAATAAATAGAGTVTDAEDTGSAMAPRAQLTGLSCRSPSEPSQRAVSIETVMRPVPGTRALSLQLTLLESRRGAGAATQVVSPGSDLGVWLSPAVKTLGRRPGDVWKLAKSVYDLDAPARYRFAVQFRWLGKGGAVLHHETLHSAACAITDPRPDLAVGSVAVKPIEHHRRRDRYVAVIANRGASASGPFTVQFTPAPGATPQTRAVGSVAAGRRVRVRFTGPACDTSAPPVIVADPGGRVDDSDRANNALTVACPEK